MIEDILNIEPVINLGRVQKPKGLSGAFTLTAFGDIFLNFRSGQSIQLYDCLKARDGVLENPMFRQSIVVNSIRLLQKKLFLIQADSIVTVGQAESLKGMYVGLPLSQAKAEVLQSDSKDNFYFFMFLCMRVFDKESNEEIGEIVRIEEASTSFIAYIESYMGDKKYIVPLDGPYIQKPDLQNNTVHIEGINNFEVDW